MKHLKEYSDEELNNLRSDLKSTGFKDPLPQNLTVDNFFEETFDHDDYVDVSGMAVDFIIEEAINEVKERIDDIPQQHRKIATQAIAELWMDRIQQNLLR
jgi:hypothetical protein